MSDGRQATAGQCFRITDGVMLTGLAIEVALDAVQIAWRYRRGQGAPLRALEQLSQVLSAAMSPAGQADGVLEPVGQAGVMVDITTEEAAGLLRCSARQARRLAPALDGRRVGGRWVFDRLAVMEHIEGRKAS